MNLFYERNRPTQEDNVTLGVAWIRAIGGVREFIVASDSRLSGGQYWDANPKIMLLPRSDCVLSFAGDTNDAYPLMLQAYNAILMFERLSNRSTDIAVLKGHLVRVFNHSRKFISNNPVHQVGAMPPDVSFMLAGYSWREKRFRSWLLHFDRSIGRFTFRPTYPWEGQHGREEKMISFVGDKNAILAAKQKLISILRSNGRLSSGGLNMEPFEVLRDIIRGNQFPSVGGPIQLVKVYEHMNVSPFGVYWPDVQSKGISVLGRPLMGYEKTVWGVIDPDDLTSIPQRP